MGDFSIKTDKKVLKLFDFASSILSCKQKQEEFYLNKMAIISLCNCSKLSESYLSSTFQLGVNQIVYQLQSINIFKDIIHMSYSNNIDNIIFPIFVCNKFFNIF
jgi:hypothetical protein